MSLNDTSNYSFSLSSYEPVKATVTKPELNYEAAAQLANQMIDSRGGSHESNSEWFSVEFGVTCAHDLFKCCIIDQQNEIEAYVESEIRRILTGSLALRVEQPLPEEMVLGVAAARYEEQLKNMQPAGAKDLHLQNVPDMILDAAKDMARNLAYQDVLRMVALETYAAHFNLVVDVADMDAFKRTDTYKQAVANGVSQQDLVRYALHEKAYQHLKDASSITIIAQ